MYESYAEKVAFILTLLLLNLTMLDLNKNNLCVGGNISKTETCFEKVCAVSWIKCRSVRMRQMENLSPIYRASGDWTLAQFDFGAFLYEWLATLKYMVVVSWHHAILNWRLNWTGHVFNQKVLKKWQKTGGGKNKPKK